MVVPDGGECVLAQLHDSADPASYSALSLLHFPAPAINPIILAGILQESPEVKVHWVGRVTDRGPEGLCLEDLVSCVGSGSSSNSSSNNSNNNNPSAAPPLPPCIPPCPMWPKAASQVTG